MTAGRPDRSSLVCVAEVASPHGVRGAFKLRCFTETPEGALAYGPLLDEQGRELFRPRLIGHWRQGVIVRAAQITDRGAAERLRGRRLHVPRAALPPTAPDEFYHHDLIGLAVYDEAGAARGEVLAVHDFGAGTLLEVGADRRRSVLIPFTREAVPGIDLQEGRVTIAVAPLTALLGSGREAA